LTPLEDQQLLLDDTVFQEKIAMATKQAVSKPGDQPKKAKHEM
jgi:hypothetical protein